DFKALNKACPQSEWFEKFGKLVGPYQGQRAIYFIDEHYNRYTWASPGPRVELPGPHAELHLAEIKDTIGSAICCREIMEQINLVRRVRGEGVYSVVELGHTDFKTGFGLRQRPFLLKIKEWVRLTPGRVDSLPARDAAPVAEITSQDSSATKASGAPADAQPVTKPTAKEVTGDEILY